jgi:DNA-binding CsgD family transcriptional regulator
VELLERDLTLQQLQTLCDAADSGQGCLALIGGEAGVGKSAVVQQFCESVRGRADVYVGACDPLSTPTPLGPLLEIAPALDAHLEELLQEAAPARRVFGALLARLSSGPRARVLVFEDVHWADAATLDLLRFLARRVHTMRTLLVATYRDDEVGPSHPLRVALGDLVTAAVVRVGLAALSLDGVGKMAAGSGLDVHELYRRTGGNPFFVSQVLATPAAGVPVSIRDALLARLSRLATPARAVLEAAALCGPRVDPWLVERVVPQAPASLDACVDAGLLSTERNQLMFRHELVREAVLDTLPAHRQVALHRLILAALVDAGVRDDLLARLAHHAEGAGDTSAVLEYAPAAARYASQLGAHRESAAQYARALGAAAPLDLRQRALLLEGRGQECYLVDQALEVVDARRAAVDIWHALGDREREGDNLRLLSRGYWLAGQNDAAEERAAQSLRLLESGAPRLALAGALSNYAQMRYFKCDYTTAISAAQRAVKMATAWDTPDARSIAIDASLTGDAARWVAGDDAGRRALEVTLGNCVAQGFENQAARAFSIIVALSANQYQLDRAERYLQLGLDYTHEHDLQMYRHWLLMRQSVLLLVRGRWSEALERAQAIDTGTHHSVTNRIDSLIVIGLVRARRGEPGAWESLDRALEQAETIGEPQRVVPVRVARAELAWLEHNLERSAAEARPAFDLAVRAGYPWWWVAETAIWLGRAGRLPTARLELPPQIAREIAGDCTGAAEVWQQLGCPYEQACALYESDRVANLRLALGLAEKLGALTLAARVVERLHQHGTRRASPRARAPTAINTRAAPPLSGLSRREGQVATLVAQAYTNREIAERLTISERTAAKHVQNILNRLGLRSRTQIAAWAVQRGVAG